MELTPIAGVIWEDKATQKMYAFCDRECKDVWVMSDDEHAPDNLEEKWGCWWCGKSVYPGGAEAWEDPKNRMQ